MDIFRLFGIGEGKIMAQGSLISGTVADVSRSYLYVIKKPVRLYLSEENTRFSHYLTFTYTVEGTRYTGKRWVSCRYRCPHVGEQIDLFYDPKDPKRWACAPFPLDTRRF